MKQSEIFVKSSSNMLAWYFYFCDFILIFVIHTAIYVYARVFLEERNFGFFSLHGYKYAERVLRKRTTEKCGQTRGLVTP